MYHLGYINSRLGTPALDGSVFLKFLLETRLNESFETLDDLQSFWVQKLAFLVRELG